MTQGYIRCAECGELVLADTVGWACQKCMGQVENKQPASVQVINRLFQDVNDILFGKEAKNHVDASNSNSRKRC